MLSFCISAERRGNCVSAEDLLNEPDIENYKLDTYKDLEKYIKDANITDEKTKELLKRISLFGDKQIREFWLDTMVVGYLAKGIFDDQSKEITYDDWHEFVEQVIEDRLKKTHQGVAEDGGCYHISFIKGDKPRSKQLTNFIFINIRKTVTNSNKNHILIADVIKGDSISLNVTLNGEDLSKPIEFRTTMRKKANAMLSMEIEPKEFGELISYIDTLPYTPLISIPYLGYHYDGEVPFLAYAGEVRNGYNTQKVVKMIMPDGVQGLSQDIYFEGINASEIKFDFVECDKEKWVDVANTVLSNLPFVNNESQMKIMIAWFIASPLRHMLDIKDFGFRFPFLHIAGTPGAGKTSLLSVLTGMMGYKYSAGSSFTTKFTIMKNMSENNSLFFWIDEYKVDSKHKRESALFLSDLLRKGYDSGLEERGNKDQSNIAYQLISPVVISGESEFTDAAVLERTIQLILSAEEMDKKYKGNKFYKNINALGNDVKFFAKGYHQWLINHNDEWEEWIGTALNLVNSFEEYNLKERIKKKGISIALGLIILQKLAEHVGIDDHIYNDDAIKAVLVYLFEANKENSKSESLEFHFLDFLADKWTDGLTNGQVDQGVTVRVDLNNHEVVFRQSAWISYFRKHCIYSDLGPQQDNIIRRMLSELERQGCVKSSNIAKSIAGKIGKCFVIDIVKIHEQYKIEPQIWKYDAGSVLDEGPEIVG
jgi:hypothetical protein